MSYPKQILAAAKRILLVDWPNTELPRALVDSGFAVFCASPNKYTEASVVAYQPSNLDGLDVFPPKNDTETGYLVFRRLDGAPEGIDIVNVYRPEAELAGIVERHILPLGAKVLWLQPPNTSAQGANIAKANGLVFVEGINIADVAKAM